MKKYRAVVLVACTIIALVTLGYLLVRGAHFDVLQPAGAVAKSEKSLMIFAFSIMMLVVIPVFIMLVTFAWKYRAGNDKKVDYRPEWSEHKLLEAAWWGIPILIILILGTAAWITAHTLDPYRKLDSKTAPVNVQVVALEWKWLFIYPDLGVAAVNELPVPVNTPVHFTITADAPMSAFWVPALGTQIYAMNGMSSQLNLIADHTGTFTGYNTNINGEGYAKMKFKVYAKSDKDFTSWIASARKSPNMMDEQALQKISQPGTMNETAYMLMDNNLYDKVVMKYMKGTMPDKDTTSTSTQHDMSNMEGM
jgi:cytochrome o ubiquinol oxidase subunit 2